MADHIKIGDITPWIQVEQTVLGTTAFEFPFPIFEDADLEVYVDATLKTLTTHYTVAGAGDDDGGTATFLVAPAVGAFITMRRRLAIKRETDFQESGEFRANVLNGELDYQTAALQQVANDIARSLVTAPTDPAGNLTLPTLASRLGKFWLWDPTTGNPSLAAGVSDAPVSAAMEAIVAAVSVAAARVLLGLGAAAEKEVDEAGGVQSYDAATAKTDEAQSFTKAQRGTPVPLTSATAHIAVDLSLGNNYSHTFTENTTIDNPTNMVAGQEGCIFLTQHASAPKTLAYGSKWDFPAGVTPTVTAANSARDTLVYVVRDADHIEAKLIPNWS